MWCSYKALAAFPLLLGWFVRFAKFVLILVLVLFYGWGLSVYRLADRWV